MLFHPVFFQKRQDARGEGRDEIPVTGQKTEKPIETFGIDFAYSRLQKNMGRKKNLENHDSFTSSMAPIM
jgi:hypothetical protein